MARICNDCVADEAYCKICTRNPNNPRFYNYYKPYNPTCRFNHINCIHDPAYIFHYDEEWYYELYGDITPEEAAQDKEGCLLCHHGEYYDDEDK